jgi:hypothetical protein
VSAVKIGYVVVYRNPPAQMGLDSFLVISTPNNVVRRSTDGLLEKATVFEEKSAAEAFLALDPAAGDRAGEVVEVHQVTYRKLAAAFKGWPQPSAIDYNVKLTAPPADQEPADGHAPAVATGTPGSPQFK